MFKKILIGLAAVIAVLVVVIMTRPDDFRYSRSIVVAAPPAAVFAHINDFHKWDAWSPWAKIDPNCKYVFEGAAAGKGAVFKWAGNSEVGEGKQEILESREGELIHIKLDFVKPFTASNDTEFKFAPEGNGTKITWSMYGKSGFMGRAFGLFVDCEKMVCGDFEKGLASIKSIVETPAKP
jgi:hypothetical protein